MEEQIYAIAYRIHQKYDEEKMLNDAHEIWLMAGDFLKQLIVPFDRHPLACKLMQYTVNYYCRRWEEAHLPEAV
jgi:hypothetical protein